ncbi:hypothetical protein CONLIGDRAFT_64922 [Coniochaeta ligniaria NRRL 30616]|uniref:Uncharacterized protein n=1 Tax=Coniochaeta ligniaria NRRL 30616 TaxID=1408157 RepID=A0A1J7JQD9_9PEZI|nr:hypothetical protein CONLIGDRAFT_64922 [Coniochaeta ligniaria NRRL 30616]
MRKCEGLGFNPQWDHFFCRLIKLFTATVVTCWRHCPSRLQLRPRRPSVSGISFCCFSWQHPRAIVRGRSIVRCSTFGFDLCMREKAACSLVLAWQFPRATESRKREALALCWSRTNARSDARCMLCHSGSFPKG